MSDSIALIASSESEAEARLVVARFAHLLERGWDAHLVFDAGDVTAWSTLPELAEPDLAPCVHLSPAHRPRGRARAAIPASLASRLARNPAGTWRYLRAGGRPRPTLLRGHDVEAALIAIAPRVIHFDSARSARGRLRVKAVVDARTVVSFAAGELDPLPPEPVERDRSVWRQADVLHVPDERLWSVLVASGCPPDKPRAEVPVPVAAAVGPGPARRASREPGGLAGPLRVLSLGPLSWRQGHEWALQAVRVLVDSGVDCVLRIVGRGEHADAVHFARYQLDLEDRVEIVDDDPRAAGLEPQLAWADVYLDAAVAAGSRSAVLEALAAELPAVVTDRTAIPYDALDESTGFVVPRRDPAALAGPLARLATDAALRGRMGRAARERAVSRFSIEEHLAGFERVYRRLLEP
jgi:colanic acid/amylovoran biosynthesis glycosyltransferase